MFPVLKINSVLFAMFSLTLMQVSFADSERNLMKEDKVQVKSWNHFVKLSLDLHHRQVKGKKIKKTEKVGGYRSRPEYYREVTYTDVKTGRVLSKIQWEQNQSANVHSIEVFVYNKQGRLVRDYAAAYLPDQRNAPVQTLINFHTYNGGLHAFRQFDAGKDIIYESCEGKFNGKDHQLRLFEDDLAATDYDSRQLLKSPVYKACFKGMPSVPGKYLRPQ